MNKDLKATFGVDHPLLNVLSTDTDKRDKAIAELRKSKEGRDVLEVVSRIMAAEIEEHKAS